MTHSEIDKMASELMEKHSKPHWAKLSLEEWVYEYNSSLSCEVQDEAYKILEKAFALNL